MKTIRIIHLFQSVCQGWMIRSRGWAFGEGSSVRVGLARFYEIAGLERLLWGRCRGVLALARSGQAQAAGVTLRPARRRLTSPALGWAYTFSQ